VLVKIDLFEVRGLVPKSPEQAQKFPRKAQNRAKGLSSGRSGHLFRFADNFCDTMVSRLQNATNLDMSNCGDEDRLQGMHCPLCTVIHAS
jgi:hypothetical protein